MFLCVKVYTNLVVGCKFPLAGPNKMSNMVSRIKRLNSAESQFHVT